MLLVSAGTQNQIVVVETLHEYGNSAEYVKNYVQSKFSVKSVKIEI
jgi:hypothetical protein